MEIHQKSKYIIAISKNTLQVKGKKNHFEEKELYLTVKKPWDNYISLELITPETSFFFDNKHLETVSFSV